MKRIVLTSALVLGGLLGLGSFAYADRTLGEGGAVDTVPAYGSVTYPSEWFTADEWAAVSVLGDGSTVLKVTVLDEAGNLIDSDSGFNVTLTWKPIWTGPFSIVVQNLGDEANTIAVGTN